MKGRVYSTFYIATLYDKYISIMAPFVCYEILKIKKGKNKVFFLWILLFLSGIGVALTFSRTGLLLYIATLIILFFSFIFYKRFKEILGILFILICMFFLPGVKYSFMSAIDTLYSITGLSQYFDNSSAYGDESVSNGNVDSSLEYRDYYKSIGKVIINENSIDGIGLGNYSYIYNNQNIENYIENKEIVTHKYMYPHSSYIQLGAETGYVGVILFYLSLASTLLIICLFNHRKKFLLIYVFLLMLAIGYVEGVIYAKQFIYIFVIIFGLYLNKNEDNKKKINNNKITFLLLHLGYGGIESSTINTANALIDKYDIEIMSFYKLCNSQFNKLDNKIKIIYLFDGGPNKKEFIEALHNYKIFKLIKEGCRAINILIKKKIKVIKYIINCDSRFIVSTRYDFSVLLSKYGSSSSIKIAQEHHYHNNEKKYINILSNKYNNIDYLFALTKTLEKDYKEFLKNNNHTKVVLVPNMLYDIPDVNSSLKDKNIITVSRLDEGKRINEIIKIFSKIEDKDWKLYVVGDGNEYYNLNKLISDLDLDDKVILTGYKDKNEIEEYMLKSSIFLMASVTEGLPMVLLEAMSYGVPCIAYETASGVNDIIKDNENGYVITNRDENNYVNKLDILIKDINLRKQVGKKAKETAYTFSKEKVLDIWNKILK